MIVAAGGAAPPDTAFDNFNRSDGPLGSNWTTVTGLAAPAIVSNQATVGTNNTDNAAYYNAVSPTSNQYAYAVWTSSSGDGGVAARMQSAAATFYLCHIYANFYLNIYEVTEGSFVSRANTTLTISSGDIIRIECTGTNPTSISFKVNGTERLSYSDTSPIENGKPGIHCYDNTTTFNSWGGGSL